MRIDEFFDNQIDDSLPFNVVDDIAIYMRNDPAFYRKKFFPVVMRMKDMHDKGKSIDPEIEFSTMINHAIESYCRTFDLGKRPEELIDDAERKELVQKIYSEEMTQIRNGAY
tara:strand:+ start:146 stop:481 length:336 start_codon:yes stop_codon:yes gene_type:complete